MLPHAGYQFQSNCAIYFLIQYIISERYELSDFYMDGLLCLPAGIGRMP